MGEVCNSFEYGLNAAAKEFDGINKYIRITDIDDDSRVFLDSDLTSPDCDLSSTEKYKLQDGDIVFARTGASVGKTFIYKVSDGLVYYAGFLIRAKINANSYPDFVFYNTLTKEYEKFIRITSQRSGQPGVNAQEYSSFEFSLPSYEEQKRIGRFFRNLDHLITLHQRQHFLHSTPDISLSVRLIHPFYTSSWEQRKLGEVVNVYDGVHQTPDYKDSGIMFLSVENIGTLKSKKYISEEAFNRDYKVYPQKGDILMTRIGDVGTPNVVETTEKMAFYVSLALLKPINVDSYFLCDSILSPFFQNGLKERTLVTAIPQKINKDDIGKVSLFVPISKDEQRQIGAFFTNINNLITLHQRKPFLMKWRTSDANRNQTNRLVL